MKRVLLDTNVVLDLIDRERRGHQNALALEKVIESKKLRILCAWHSLSIIEYIGGKTFGRAHTHELLKGLLSSFVIPKTGTEDALRAFQYLDQDYEDALQIAAALAGSADAIITNDQAGFSKSPLPVFAPAEFVNKF